MFDEDFRITQAERDGIGEMRHRLFQAAKRLVGDRDIVMGGRVGAVEFECLTEQLHRQFIAAALLHHVAQQHEAAHMAGISAQRQAAKIFRLDELAFAVMRYSRCVNIVSPGGLKRAAGRLWRQRESGLFGRCSSRLSIHYAVFSNDFGTDPARLSGQASVAPPEDNIYTIFMPRAGSNGQFGGVRSRQYCRSPCLSFHQRPPLT